MEVTINDLQNLMNGGIGKMREEIEKRYDTLEDVQNRVNKEYLGFKNKCRNETLNNPDYSFNHNMEIYTKVNLYLFFWEQDSDELWDSLIKITRCEDNVTEEEIINFLKLSNILDDLWIFEARYDTEIHTDTWDNILILIKEFIITKMR